MKKLLILALAACGIVACKNSTANSTYKDLEALDLSKYGVNMTIQAPKGATVEKDTTMVLISEVSIKKPEVKYAVDIYSEDALPGTTVGSVKAARLEEVKAREGFSRIIKETDNGFIYELKWSDTQLDYDFFYVLFKGDKTYTISSDLDTNTQAEAEGMYESVAN